MVTCYITWHVKPWEKQKLDVNWLASFSPYHKIYQKHNLHNLLTCVYFFHVNFFHVKQLGVFYPSNWHLLTSIWYAQSIHLIWEKYIKIRIIKQPTHHIPYNRFKLKTPIGEYRTSFHMHTHYWMVTHTSFQVRNKSLPSKSFIDVKSKGVKPTNGQMGIQIQTFYILSVCMHAKQLLQTIYTSMLTTTQNC